MNVSGIPTYSFNFKMDCWQYTVTLSITYYFTTALGKPRQMVVTLSSRRIARRVTAGFSMSFLFLLWPLKEMLFKKGHKVPAYVVLRLASYGDVADLYLLQPLPNVPLCN